MPNALTSAGTPLAVELWMAAEYAGYAERHGRFECTMRQCSAGPPQRGAASRHTREEPVDGRAARGGSAAHAPRLHRGEGKSLAEMGHSNDREVPPRESRAVLPAGLEVLPHAAADRHLLIH